MKRVCRKPKQDKPDFSTKKYICVLCGEMSSNQNDICMPVEYDGD